MFKKMNFKNILKMLQFQYQYVFLQIVLHLKKCNFSTTFSMIKGSSDSNKNRYISFAEFSTKVVGKSLTELSTFYISIKTKRS